MLWGLSVVNVNYERRAGRHFFKAGNGVRSIHRDLRTAFDNVAYQLGVLMPPANWQPSSRLDDVEGWGGAPCWQRREGYGG